MPAKSGALFWGCGWSCERGITAALYRLVPRKGAGPDLRSEGGGKIDEYLMRLLRTGTVPTDANTATWVRHSRAILAQMMGALLARNQFESPP